ncbi:MAG: hypothetical protein L3J24_15110 [Xanthomonadales bacterium]|nr:hypothetical protein [Xanthomonadales bacterium]
MNNKQIIGAPIGKYLGIWCVNEIFEGSQGICGDWATIGHHIALFQRKDGVVLGFTECGFCLESYEPFWFRYNKKTKLLQGLGRDGIVQITIGFSDPGFKKIVFNFCHANGDSYSQSGGWDGTHTVGGGP